MPAPAARPFAGLGELGRLRNTRPQHMAVTSRDYRGHLRAVWAALAVWTASGAAWGQPPSETPAEFWQPPALLPLLQPLTWVSASTTPPSVPAPEPRFRLFRVQPGFLNEPVGLDSDDPPTDTAAGMIAPDPDGDFFSRLEVAIGIDNPFFDFRSRYDPGGVGYYKMYTQYQLIDTGTTCWSIGLQA